MNDPNFGHAQGHAFLILHPVTTYSRIQTLINNLLFLETIHPFVDSFRKLLDILWIVAEISDRIAIDYCRINHSIRALHDDAFHDCEQTGNTSRRHLGVKMFQIIFFGYPLKTLFKQFSIFSDNLLECGELRFILEYTPLDEIIGLLFFSLPLQYVPS